MLVNSPPEVVQVASDADEHFVQEPLVTGFRPPLEGLGGSPSEAQAPLADGLVADHDASRREDQFDFTQAEAEAVIQSHCLIDDVSQEAVAPGMGWT